MKYRFSFTTNDFTWKYPNVEISHVLGKELYKKAYNAKRILIEKERSAYRCFGTRYEHYSNKWLFSFTIDITPKEAFELGEMLNRKYHRSVRYSKKGCNVH